MKKIFNIIIDICLPIDTLERALESVELVRLDRRFRLCCSRLLAQTGADNSDRRGFGQFAKTACASPRLLGRRLRRCSPGWENPEQSRVRGAVGVCPKCSRT